MGNFINRLEIRWLFVLSGRDVVEKEPPTHIELESAPEGSLRVGELERWTRYKCSACGKSVMGYDAEAHIKEKHKGVDVGFLK